MKNRIYILIVLFCCISTMKAFVTRVNLAFNAGKVVAGSMLAIKMSYDMGKNLYHVNEKRKTLNYLQKLFAFQQYDRIIRSIYGNRTQEIDREIESHLKLQKMMLAASSSTSSKEWVRNLKDNQQEYEAWKQHVIEKEKGEICKSIISNYHYKYTVAEAYKYNITPDTFLRLSFFLAGLDIAKDGIRSIIAR